MIEIANLIHSSEPFIYLTTSATTGEPKLVAHTPSSLFSNADAVIDALNYDQTSSWGCALSTSRIAGLMVAIRSYRKKGHAIFSRRIENLPFVTHLSLIPSQFYDLVEKDEIERFKNTLLFIGGSDIPNWIINYAKEKKLRIHTSYAMTETASSICIDGIPLSNMDIKISDAILRIKSPFGSFVFRV